MTLPKGKEFYNSLSVVVWSLCFMADTKCPLNKDTMMTIILMIAGNTNCVRYGSKHFKCKVE